MLVIEIEYLNLVSYASKFNRTHEPEWPPHPDRVFMALVDAWGVAGREPSGADALRWLESQGSPDLAAPNAHRRSRFRSFVPTSSGAIGGLGYLAPGYIEGITTSIVRKERTFPAVVLPDDSPTVHMIWGNAEPDGAVLDALSALAGRVSHIGHSASVTRVAVRRESGMDPTYVPCESGDRLLRCPSPGRLAALESEYDNASESMVPVWPTTAKTCRYGSPAAAVDESVMGGGGEWVVLSVRGGRGPLRMPGNAGVLSGGSRRQPDSPAQDGYVPSLRAFPAAAKRLRDAIMSHIPNPVHEAISGHGPDGSALKGPHLAILPMANVGWGRYSDGELMGMALVLPRRSVYGTDERRQLRQAVAALLDPGRGGGVLKMGRFGTMALRRSADAGKKSLLPDRYTCEGRTWASVTPVVLDRHPKKTRSAREIVADSCSRVGLSRPVSVRISRHSSVPGAPPAFVGKGATKSWLPPKPGLFDNAYVCHASITFGNAVRGPVILGAARYYGMGLFMRAEGGVP